MSGNPLHFRQSDPVARQMNFDYLIGDRAGRYLVVDPAWSVEDRLRIAPEDGMQIEGVVATHHYPDHVGGDLFVLRPGPARPGDVLRHVAGESKTRRLLGFRAEIDIEAGLRHHLDSFRGVGVRRCGLFESARARTGI